MLTVHVARGKELRATAHAANLSVDAIKRHKRHMQQARPLEAAPDISELLAKPEH
jgi:hypothetical protein